MLGIIRTRAGLGFVLVALVACSDSGDDSPLSGSTRETAASGAPDAITVLTDTPCNETADHVVIISDFAYAPPFLNVKVGETVAWINVEACPSMPLEDLVVPFSGCDTHHEVVTFPASPGGDSIDSGLICSPNRGAPPPPGAAAPVDTRNCADQGASNVFCHTFTKPGMQHYTCFVNPGHTLLLHGYLNVE